MATQAKRNWVFLGDSLTEGVGSERVSHVTELVDRLRSDKPVHHVRLRRVDPASFDRYVRFNLAGYMALDDQQESNSLWIWNLAAEGQTIETDFEWLPLVQTLEPQLVVIFRGSLESIIRPAMVRDGLWPWWVPQSWRSYAAMDPRCYFSSTWWRRTKQVAIDRMKLRARLKLLRTAAGRPLMDLDQLATHYAELIKRLRHLGARVLVLGLLPVGEINFPTSRNYFLQVNTRLCEIATSAGAEFFDWATLLTRRDDYPDLFYRDSFHPNADGAKVLAEILHQRLQPIN